MRVIHAKPPIYDEAAAAFPLKRGVIFAWGDVIYAPNGGAIHPALMAHEAVHGHRQQQAWDILDWWRRYIADPAFRLAEEIPAHRAEYRWWLDNPEGTKPMKGFRCAHAYQLIQIAARLASPLYGSLISAAEAKRVIAA